MIIRIFSKKARWFVGIKEYILYKLFGVLKEDYSIANATGMFNIYNLDWDDQALKIAGVTRINCLSLSIQLTS